MEFVPRMQKQRADALTQLAKTRKPGNNRSVRQEFLKSPNLEGELVCYLDRAKT